jgi:predicted glycosyltransferase
VKIVFYCQHVLGLGHLFRSLEICEALDSHEVILITGGPHVDVELSDHIREFRLQELQMDRDFKGLFSSESSSGLKRIKDERQKRLFDFFKRERPDLFIMELYPFGRKAFRYELDPVLHAIREKKLNVCGVFSSVRDILVEKEDQELHELRALRKINNYFDGVLIHSDPDLVTLDETFYHYDDIRVPVVYTGYIAPKPLLGVRARLRQQLGIRDDDRLVVASAGGGTVGAPLLESVIKAFSRLDMRQSLYLRVFTGPYLDHDDFKRLKLMAKDHIHIERFVHDFLLYMAAADLSISMGGYNTTMNILATGVPALVWPFPQNQEQRLRAERLEQRGLLRILGSKDMDPNQLASVVEDVLADSAPTRVPLNLDGAVHTAEWLERWAQNRAYTGCHKNVPFGPDQ